MTPSLPQSTKSFFSRPEGKVGLIPPIAFGILIFYFWGLVSDFVVHAMDDLLHTIIVGVVSFALLLILADPKFRATVFYLYRSIMRAITGIFVNIDPIGILKTYVERLMEKLAEMDKSIGNLNAQKITVKRAIDDNDKEISHSYGLIQASVNHPSQDTERIKSKEGKNVTRWEEQNKRFNAQFSQIQFLIKVLNQYRTMSADTIDDINQEIRVRTIDRKVSKGAQSAIRSAAGILKGLPEKDLYDESMDALTSQYDSAMGEVDGFLDLTKNILANSNLEDAAGVDKAEAMLREWQTKNGTVSFGKNGSTKADVIQNAMKQISDTTTPTLPITYTSRRGEVVPVNRDASDDYSEYLK